MLIFVCVMLTKKVFERTRNIVVISMSVEISMSPTVSSTTVLQLDVERCLEKIIVLVGSKTRMMMN